MREGLGPEWVHRVSDIGLDDLPAGTTYEEAKEMAIGEFKLERHKHGTHQAEYEITDILLA